MQHRFSRTELLIGPAGLAKLAQSKVAVFGVGGVGSFAVEGLARAGIGQLTLVDHDEVSITNLNRQLHALEGTVGKAKVELMQERIEQINPQARVVAIKKFYTPENSHEFFNTDYDYIIDAIDNVTGKLDLIQQAKKRQIPIVSAMGAGNKLDPTAFKVADISETSVCPLAKIVRRELRKAGISKGVKVVYSPEPPRRATSSEDQLESRPAPGSISFVPSVAGLILAGEVVKDLLGNDLTKE